MNPIRALIYAIAVFVFLFGSLLIPMLVFGEARSLTATLAILIPFGLPSIGVISFLLITESDHRKAWVLKETQKQYEWTKDFESSGNAQTFGILTAVLWF